MVIIVVGHGILWVSDDYKNIFMFLWVFQDFGVEQILLLSCKNRKAMKKKGLSLTFPDGVPRKWVVSWNWAKVTESWSGFGQFIFKKFGTYLWKAITWLPSRRSQTPTFAFRTGKQMKMNVLGFVFHLVLLSYLVEGLILLILKTLG